MANESMDSREGFSKGDHVRRVGGPGSLPEDGVVQGWYTFEYDPTKWYCCVTWGGQYIGRYQADEIEHAPYRIGEPDIECRYPVILGGTDRVVGRAYRWHRDWLVVTSAGEKNLGRPDTGAKGIDKAATWLVEEYAAGRITAVPLDQVRADEPQPLTGPIPLLHPRMPATPRNIAGAMTAFAGLAEHHWRPLLTGFPGSDNPWVLSCELCGWQGPRYWSHLRGRNGQPPSIFRHDGGCVGEDKVRELIAAYQR